MKKIIVSAFLLTAFLGSVSISGQEKIELQKYDYVTNGDTNLYQGIPNIGFPLFNVDVPTTGIGISLSVNYSTESVSSFNLISDVGKGWNLSAIGSIVRSKTRQAEDYKLSGTNEALSDVYYYNYPGGSGRFYIGMDSVSHELLGVHTSPSNDKIIVTKDPAKTGKVLSFTVIDTKGNRYVFDKININILQKSFSFGGGTTQLINSGFFLSKIYNVKNEEVVSIEYETTTELVNQVIGNIQQQKIKKITVNGTGTIEYLYLPNLEPHKVGNTIRDWYQLDKVVLKDTRNQIVNQYKFTHGYNNLTDLINLDKNNNPIQKFSFEYNNDYPSGIEYKDAFGYSNFYDPCSLDEGELRSPGSTNRNTAAYETLKRVTLPTGGVIEYEFESNAVKKEGTDPECYGQCTYDNHDFDKIYTLNFDTAITAYYTITLPPGYKNKLFYTYEYLFHPSSPPRPGVPNTIDCLIKQGDAYVSGSPFINPYTGNECGGIQYVSSTGTTADIFFNGARSGHGTMYIYAAKDQARDENEYGYGLRIKSIKNFNPGSTTPVSFINYQYNNFNNSQQSSGQILDLSPWVDFVDGRNSNNTIGYTNIKVTNMIDGNYSKYYFIPQQDINTGNTPSFAMLDQDMSSYLKANGLLQRKEEYNAANQILQKSEMSYELKDVALANIIYGGNAIKKINISKQSSTTESYISGASKKLVSSSETNVEDKYNNVSSTKETLADGTVIEKTFLYPEDKGIQKLLNANMIDIPLETSTKKNGKQVGKAETKFDNASHLYPTSVASYNMETQTAVIATTLDIYDSKGNLVQTTGKNGIPVTTIWGYYQTKPIAVIAGASYAQVSSLASVTAAIAASNADHDDPSKEPQLLTALENLRKDSALQNYTVSATTYDPMIGVTNSISSNGIRTINVYDSANRLIKVTDAAGKTLQEHQYNYKN